MLLAVWIFIEFNYLLLLLHLSIIKLPNYKHFKELILVININNSFSICKIKALLMFHVDIYTKLKHFIIYPWSAWIIGNIWYAANCMLLNLKCWLSLLDFELVCFSWIFNVTFFVIILHPYTLTVLVPNSSYKSIVPIL